jgi:hypothetical protein
LPAFVALKCLPEHLAQDRQAWNASSAKRAPSALDHRNISTNDEIGEHDGQPFIALQLLEGQALREGIGVGGFIPPSRSL